MQTTLSDEERRDMSDEERGDMSDEDRTKPPPGYRPEVDPYAALSIGIKVSKADVIAACWAHRDALIAEGRAIERAAIVADLRDRVEAVRAATKVKADPDRAYYDDQMFLETILSENAGYFERRGHLPGVVDHGQPLPGGTRRP